MSKIIGLFLILALARADHPIWELDELPETRELTSRNDEQVYRLPESVVPIEYDIYIDLYFDERDDRPFSYDGRENIIIQAVEENVNQIVLHSNVDTISGISLRTDGVLVALDASMPFTTEPQYHFLKINLVSPMVVGVNYTLTIVYASTMNEGPMKRGIWRGWYVDGDGVDRIYATTHFQPYNARQAFPCWDEPLFKSVFKLHLSTPRSYRGTFSNTAVETLSFIASDRILEDFHTTPRMSSYLVTFLVSETFQVIAEDTSFTPAIRIIGRSNTAGLADHVLDLAVNMTRFFDEYFQIPYSTLHENLLNDHVSSPDWASAGTENWGMVSYRELYMIIDPRETIMSIEHYAATLVSHELAHKWFGNLITCYWWSNTWINEGFASYFGYIATNEMYPEYELDEHFNSRYLQNSLSFDSGTTVPMNHDVNTPAQVTGHFGTISYSKAAAFLRMTADIITLDTFRKACQYFLERNKFEPTDQYDLYEAFAVAIAEDNSLSQYQYFNFTDYYRIWVNEPGYPILNVDIDHGTGEMSLHQERFFLSATATPTDQVYPIPITYSSASSANFENLRPIYILTSQRAVLEKSSGAEWVIFNHLQHGHYRVNYDDRTWDLIADALVNTPDAIHHLNRAQVVDDVFALMRSGRMTYNKGFSILRFLRTESNYHVWTVAISGYSWIRNRFRHLPETLASFDAHVLSYMQHVIDTVGFEPSSDETPTTSLTRQEVLQFACNIGHEECLEESLSRFLEMREGTWIDPRIRRNVYMTGLRQGGTEDFDFLLNRLLQSNYANDQLEMMRALGATSSPELVLRYLDFTLTRDVRSHDKATAFVYALSGTPQNAATVLEFVKNNIDEIRVAYVEDSPPTPVNTALSNLAAYLDEDGLTDYQNWLQSTQTNTMQYASAISAITTARANIAWGTANADIIIAAARDGAVTIMTSLSLLLITTALAVVV